MRDRHLAKMPRGGTTTARYEEDPDNAWNCCSWCEYLLIVILSTILLVGVLVLTLFWVMFYRDGFAWSESPKQQFNLHPILMIAGFVTLSGFSILIYRLCRCVKHIYVKLIHMFFHAVAIPCIALGFLSVFDSHEALQKVNFYSLHSWLGFVTMGMFVLQFVIGFFTFLVMLCCENKTYSCRSAMVPIHASLGLANFWLAIATSVTGLIEKERETVTETGVSPENKLIEHYITSAIGVTLIFIGIIVTFAVRRSNAPASAKVYVTERI
ncbi:transmembrane ascorbate-dependent reductase CYB561 isoform X3 [Drosophila eugracilis]|uniref:transmembrane ascorbate-dependent reductase CYB561 isoform X3 n=1 Tax=Drosophila eugracilis TaxID=29029 RepID=UPI0007E62DDD|nr:transmembrane ascorbate-dependent reductase CYB561 isoform X3 [Drosophila eugracilis]XP_017079226.1 transmembrane ascorbate-dependent reductase CYB561 isoform X3 [Drosophila eugracilis]